MNQNNYFFNSYFAALGENSASVAIASSVSVVAVVVFVAVCAVFIVAILVVRRQRRRYNPNNAIDNGLYYDQGMVVRNAAYNEPLYEEMH